MQGMYAMSTTLLPLTICASTKLKQSCKLLMMGIVPALRLVRVPQQHYKPSYLQFEVVRRQLSWLLSIQEFWGLHAGPAVPSNATMSALLNLCASMWLSATNLSCTCGWLHTNMDPTDRTKRRDTATSCLDPHCARHVLTIGLAVKYTEKADIAGRLWLFHSPRSCCVMLRLISLLSSFCMDMNSLAQFPKHSFDKIIQVAEWVLVAPCYYVVYQCDCSSRNGC